MVSRKILAIEGVRLWNRERAIATIDVAGRFAKKSRARGCGAELDLGTDYDDGLHLRLVEVAIVMIGARLSEGVRVSLAVRYSAGTRIE